MQVELYNGCEMVVVLVGLLICQLLVTANNCSDYNNALRLSSTWGRTIIQ